MRRILVFILLLGAVGAGGWYYYTQQAKARLPFALYGNVEFRQADLAFSASQRIAEVLVEEGDVVKVGEVLARLDSSTLKPLVDQAAAQVDQNIAVLDELKRGSRPEEIEQARANLKATQVEADNARQQYERAIQLLRNQTVSQQVLDQSKAASEIAAARVDASEKTLALLLAGPREEKVRQAEAQLEAAKAQHASLLQQLEDTELKAPAAAVVRARLMEPGEIASPTRAVLSLALPYPKWVRAYVPETGLGLLHEGAVARVVVDSFPDKTFSGRIGFISSVAEFTPKTVQTEDLRTSLVYEVRVLVEDPENQLRLGMPATVHLENGGTSAP